MKRFPKLIPDCTILIVGLGLIGAAYAKALSQKGYRVLGITRSREVIDAAINQAVAECEAKGIKGKETTPFLLARVSELTGGDSLSSNIQLVFNNAKVAAQTAVEFCK